MKDQIGKNESKKIRKSGKGTERSRVNKVSLKDTRKIQSVNEEEKCKLK